MRVVNSSRRLQAAEKRIKNYLGYVIWILVLKQYSDVRYGILHEMLFDFYINLFEKRIQKGLVSCMRASYLHHFLKLHWVSNVPDQLQSMFRTFLPCVKHKNSIIFILFYWRMFKCIKKIFLIKMNLNTYSIEQFWMIHTKTVAVKYVYYYVTRTAFDWRRVWIYICQKTLQN